MVSAAAQAIIDSPPDADPAGQPQPAANPQHLTTGISAAAQAIVDSPPEPDPSQQSLTSPNGLTVAPDDEWHQLYKAMGASLTEGASAMPQALQGHLMFADDKYTFQEAEKQVATHQLLQAQMDDKNYTDTHAYWHVAGTIAKAIPGLLVGGAAMGAGAVVGLTVGLPVLGTALVGGAIVAGTLAVGNTVYDLSQHGVDRQTARVAGMINGAANAALSFYGGKGVTAAATAALDKGALMTVLSRLNQSAGIQFTQQELTNISNLATKYIATRVSSSATPVSEKEIAEEFNEGTRQAIITSAAVSTGTEAGAHLVLKPIMNHFENAEHQLAATQAFFDRKGQEMQQKHQERLFGKVLKKEAKPETELPEIEGPTNEQEDNAEPTQPLMTMEQVEQARQDDLIGLATLAARLKKPASKLIGEAYKEAWAEGRDLTDEEFDALNEKVLLPENLTQSPESLATRLAKRIAGLNPLSSTSGHYSANLSGVFHIITQRMPPELAQQVIEAFDMREGVNDYMEWHGYLNKSLNHSLRKRTGLTQFGLELLAFKASHKDIGERYMDSTGKMQTGVRYIDADGNTAYFHGTAADATDVLLKMQNEKARTALLGSVQGENGNGFTMHNDLTEENGTHYAGRGYESTETALAAAIHDVDPNLLRALKGFEDFYASTGSIVEHAYTQYNPGSELPPENSYGGSLEREGESFYDTGIEVHEPGKHFEVGLHGELDPRFTHQRASIGKRIKIGNAYKRAYYHASGVARYIAFGKPNRSRLWARLMRKGGRFRKFVDANYGEEISKEITEAYEQTVHGRPQNTIDRFVAGIMAMKALRIFAFQPKYGMKHVVTALQFGVYQHDGEVIPMADLFKGFADAAKNWGSVSKEIFSRPEVQSRYENLGGMMNLTDPDAPHPLTRAVAKQATMAMEVGDRTALVLGVHAVEEWVYARTGDRELAKAESTKAFQKILSSGRQDQRSSWGRSTLGKLLIQFQTPKLILAQIDREAWRVAANYPTKQNVANAIRVSAVLRLAAAAFLMPEVVIALTNKDVNEAERKAVAALHELFLGNTMPVYAEPAKVTATEITNSLLHRKDKSIIDSKDAVGEVKENTLKCLQFVEKHGPPDQWSVHDMFTFMHYAMKGPLEILQVPTSEEAFKKAKAKLDPGKEKKKK